MKKALLASALLAAALLAGCGNTEPAAPNKTPAKTAAAETVPAEKEATLTVYLPADDGMHITRHTETVPAKDKTLKKALTRMIRADRAAAYPLLPTGLTLKSVSVADGTATVNFSKELESLASGSTTEALFVAMVVDTATEFPNVKAVRFEMEGRSLDRLGGHYDMTQLFKRDESFIAK